MEGEVGRKKRSIKGRGHTSAFDTAAFGTNTFGMKTVGHSQVGHILETCKTGIAPLSGFSHAFGDVSWYNLRHDLISLHGCRWGEHVAFDGKQLL
jgi:hypothetical protein